MSSLWNLPQPITDLFLQLTRGSQFASNGSEPIALSQLLRIGYTLIANTRLFAEACREWRKIRDIDKNMDTFQALFTGTEQDRSSLLTTSSQAGFHAGNATAAIPTTLSAPAATIPPPTEHALAMAPVQATVDATQAHLALDCCHEDPNPLPTVGLMVIPPTVATPVPRVKNKPTVTKSARPRQTQWAAWTTSTVARKAGRLISL
jgi:hypothetical protein